MAATTSPPPRQRPSLLHIAILLLAASGEDGSTRRRVYALVERFPGLHQRDIARRLEMRPSHAEHHLRHLVKAGLVRAAKQGGYARYFVTTAGSISNDAPGRADAEVLVILRQATPLRIVATLLTEGPLGLGELASRVGITAGTLTYQLDKLEACKLVLRVSGGGGKEARLVDPEETRRILLAYEPPADLAAGFEELWDDVGL